jgi:hypothetical protein
MIRNSEVQKDLRNVILSPWELNPDTSPPSVQAFVNHMVSSAGFVYSFPADNYTSYWST